MLGNHIVFTPGIKVIPFSKYLSFHLGAVLVHTKPVNLIFKNTRICVLLLSVKKRVLIIASLTLKVTLSDYPCVVPSANLKSALRDL